MFFSDLHHMIFHRKKNKRQNKKYRLSKMLSLGTYFS